MAFLYIHLNALPFSPGSCPIAAIDFLKCLQTVGGQESSLVCILSSGLYNYSWEEKNHQITSHYKKSYYEGNICILKVEMLNSKEALRHTTWGIQRKIFVGQEVL